MTNRLEINWKLDGFVDEQRYYCSEASIDPENLPTPKVILLGGARTYIDTVIEKGRKYYLAIGSVKNGIEKLSQQVSQLAGIAWDPSMLINKPQIIVDSDIFSEYTDDTPVTAWDNAGSIGGSFSQSNNANKPTLKVNILNGHHVIRFDGVNDLLDMSSTLAGNLFRNTGKAWAFIVSKGTSSALSSVFDARSNNNAARFLVRSSATQFGVSSRRLDTDSTVAQNVSVSENFHLKSGLLDYQNANLRIIIDGVDKYSGAHGTAGLTSNTTSRSGGLSIGNRSIDPASNEYFAGDIALIISGSGVFPSDDELKKLEGWAAHKYGLTGSLPADHPYKILVPTI